MASRIYKVDIEISDKPNHVARTFLVDANSPGQARAYVAGKFITCAIAKPRDVVEALKSGVEVETVAEVQS